MRACDLVTATSITSARAHAFSAPELPVPGSSCPGPPADTPPVPHTLHPSSADQSPDDPRVSSARERPDLGSSCPGLLGADSLLVVPGFDPGSLGGSHYHRGCRGIAGLDLADHL